MFPQHILNSRSEPPKVPMRTALGIATLILRINALSVSSPPRLFQPVLLKEQTKASLESRRNALLTSIAPSLDNEAWLAALFDDETDSDSSIENSLSDRIVDTSVKDESSLVDTLQLSKGADIESVLQQQAQQNMLLTASSKNKRAKAHRLTKEYEYTLARAIQSGVAVHKLKSDYESSHKTPLTKKQWATLADMDTKELRRVVAEYRSAKQELVSSNMGLVHAVAREFRKRPQCKALTLEELVQEGSLGLIRAAELFDPNKGLRFSTYATIWIKGALSNQRLDQFVKLPHNEHRSWKDIKRAMRDLQDTKGSNGKVISSDLIADKLGTDPTKVDATIKKMTSVSTVLSLDYVYANRSRSGDVKDNRLSEKFFIDAVDLAEHSRLKADTVSALVSNLNKKEILLIRLVYGFYDGKEYSIKDAAKIMGMNKETTRLLHKACLQKLREASDVDSLQEYLLTVA